MTASATRRTGQPVRRQSYHVGDREHTVWRRIDRRRIRAVIMSAQYLDRVTKQPGRKNGDLGHVAIEVLDALYRIADARTGRLEPSLDWLMRTVRRSRAAIVAALKRLEEQGFVTWIRRSIKVDTDGEAGPQVKQHSNAYGLRIPARLAAMVDALTRGKDAQTPACEEDRIRRLTADYQHMLDTLTCEELVEASVEDPDLAAVLAAIGRGLDRSSASSPGGLNPTMKSNIKGRATRGAI